MWKNIARSCVAGVLSEVLLGDFLMCPMEKWRCLVCWLFGGDDRYRGVKKCQVSVFGDC